MIIKQYRQPLTTHISVLFLICGLWLAPASAQDDQQSRLAELQAELKARQQELAENKADAEQLQDILKKSEVEIGRVASQLNKTESQLAENRKEQTVLRKQQSELKTAIVQQQSLLASQLRSAFMAGHYDYAKMLFYQDEATTFERVLTYYQYLSKARQQEISRFRSNVEELETVNARLEQKAAELAALLTKQKEQQAVLLTRQSDRKQTLAKLNKQIASDAEQVAQLQASERALMEAIETARRQAERAKTELSGLSKLKGKLKPPASGRLRDLFGNRRQGQVRWKGIIIEGAEGSSVKSISHGRILYADWLKGFGLVTIIDHGDGYMTVYGHNQALLKQAGDLVAEGDTIALVGQSGGQSYPNLYFEIRHKGKALDPTTWLAK
ncbi:peptidase M23 [Alteromonas aestuariivivens]|uniref:Peptidase M23 n=1 Tax=Alteromonas aestuariivivens TaxID=1938339 RepID=A0A3D8MA62_9ALTE|nr:peptidoglycan DD-metalloendopeptidase family protein [Alteromonas aestuariivivens]RDV26675.1 peptidase M23 [Alteromonas aestuariivivens]